MSPRAKKTQDTKKETSTGQCTVKELKFLDLLFGEANFNASRAYELAFRTRHESARVGGCNLLKKLYPIIKQWLEDEGLTENRLKFKLLRLLDAKETKFFAHEGKVTDKREVEALGIQVKALELAMKTKGMLSDRSAREIEQIDELIELELKKLGLATPKQSQEQGV